MEVEGQGTWRFGLDRLLLGVAVSTDGPLQVGGVMPLDDVGSGSVDLVGRVTELLARIGAALDTLETARTAADWMTGLTDAVLSLGDVPVRDQWQVSDLQRTLTRAGRPASASNVRSATNERAASVSTGVTSWPARTSSRQSSHAL